jgi:hypothetical protein
VVGERCGGFRKSSIPMVELVFARSHPPPPPDSPRAPGADWSPRRARRRDKAEPLSGLVSDGLTEGAATFAWRWVLFIPTTFRSASRPATGWARCVAAQQTPFDDGRHHPPDWRVVAGGLRAHVGDAPDDLTAVVIRFEPAEQARLEVGA